MNKDGRHSDCPRQGGVRVVVSGSEWLVSWRMALQRESSGSFSFEQRGPWLAAMCEHENEAPEIDWSAPRSGLDGRTVGR